MLAILSDTEATRQRMAMVEELVGSSRTPELQTIARPALRAFVRDCGAGAPGTTSQLLEKLAKFTDDAALTTDMPAIAAAARPSVLDRGATIDLQWSAHDAGALPVYDAALLPGDRLLLALGELGVRIVSRTGRTIAQIDQPATKTGRPPAAARMTPAASSAMSGIEYGAVMRELSPASRLSICST
jgi:hypothetical protein